MLLLLPVLGSRTFRVHREPGYQEVNRNLLVTSVLAWVLRVAYSPLVDYPGLPLTCPSSAYVKRKLYRASCHIPAGAQSQPQGKPRGVHVADRKRQACCKALQETYTGFNGGALKGNSELNPTLVNLGVRSSRLGRAESGTGFRTLAHAYSSKKT